MKRRPQQLSIKNHTQEKKLFVHRAFATLIFMIFLAFILVARLVYIQIIRHSVYSTLSQQNLLSVLPVEPARGLIYDRHGVLLAKNISVFNLEIVTARMNNLKNTLSDLRKIIPISDDEIANFYEHKKQYRPFQPIPLKLNLNEQEIARFYQDQYHFPGVMIQTKMLRSYPLSETASNIIGYVGRIDAKELETIDHVNYSASEYIGKTGIEKYYETELHGSVGAEQAEIDANRHIIRSLKKIPPTPGNNLYLTIDSNLQAYAEKILANNSGAIVAIQPSTGQILALVTNPRFDPNQFVMGISSEQYKKLLNSPTHPLYDRTIRGLYSPGSTIKPFYALGALDAGIIKSNTRIFDPGWFRIPNVKRLYRDAEATEYGWVNVVKALIVSSDTFFYNLAINLGMHRIDGILYSFGFGSKTGVDLPNELSGNVPTPEWKLSRFGHSWYTGDTVITGIGQGSLLVTPLQLATALSMIANRGQRIQPHLLLKSIASDGNEYISNSPLLQNLQLATHEIWDLVIEAMRGVIMNPLGTAGPTFGHPTSYTVAGKTGTAQVFSQWQNKPDTNRPFNLRNNHLFICFAPVDQPQIALVVVIEHTALATKIARQVLDFYFQEQKMASHSEVVNNKNNSSNF